MRRALVVGIDHYDAVSDLNGCCADAEYIGDLLGRDHEGDVNFEVQRLLSTSSRPVLKTDLLARVRALLSQPADAALLFFAGHGTENDLGGYLVTSDAQQYDEGVAMVDVLRLAKSSPVADVVIILDCCQAGAFGTSPLGDADGLAWLPQGLSILTGAGSDEPAVEQHGRGLFSRLVGAALQGGAADTLGKVTVASVYAYVEEALGAWQQRPQLKAHVSQLLVLRNAQASVARGDLRRLTEWFAAVDAEFPLDPSYEPDAEPPHAENEETFRLLQKLRAAKLVEPVEHDHMYFAAIESGACRLTQLGRLYWQLVDDGKL